MAEPLETTLAELRKYAATAQDALNKMNALLARLGSGSLPVTEIILPSDPKRIVTLVETLKEYDLLSMKDADIEKLWSLCGLKDDYSFGVDAAKKRVSLLKIRVGLMPNEEPFYERTRGNRDFVEENRAIAHRAVDRAHELDDAPLIEFLSSRPSPNDTCLSVLTSAARAHLQQSFIDREAGLSILSIMEKALKRGRATAVWLALKEVGEKANKREFTVGASILVEGMTAGRLHPLTSLGLLGPEVQKAVGRALDAYWL